MQPGVGADGSDTFTPRTLIYDHRSSFGTLRQINALYQISEDQNQQLPQSLWSRGTAVQRQQPIEPHPYQRSLDSGLEPPQFSKESVRYWSDYNRVYYHPRSLIQLDDPVLTQGSQLSPWEQYNTGEDVFGTLDKEHDILDRDLRLFVEEADHLQGLYLVTSTDDAWGGFASAYAERVEDEYGKVPRWIWGLEDDSPRPLDRQRLTQSNTIQSLLSLTGSGSLYMPVSNISSTQPPPYLSIDPTSQWHTSALQTAALETITLPTRLHPDDSSHSLMADIEAIFTAENSNRTILDLSLSAQQPTASTPPALSNGLPNGTSTTPMDLDEPDEPPPLDISLAPAGPAQPGPRRAHRQPHVFSRADVLRGTWPDALPSPSALARAFATPCLLPAPTSFPRIFGGAGAGVAVRARLASGEGVAERLRACGRAVGRMGALLRAEREEVYSRLVGLAEEYVGGWEGGSDDGEDE